MLLKVAKRDPENNLNSGLCWIPTHNLCFTMASCALPTELTSNLRAAHLLVHNELVSNEIHEYEQLYKDHIFN